MLPGIPKLLGIVARHADFSPELAELGRVLGLPRLEKIPDREGLVLHVRGERLELQESGAGAVGPLCVDFLAGAMARRRATFSTRDPLARAVGLPARRPHVLDATAGLGKDAVCLASIGCRVLAVERSPIIAALLQNGLARARRSPPMKTLLEANLAVIVDDARRVLTGLDETRRPEVVTIDPMYPPRDKAARPKKEMHLLRKLLGEPEDARELVEVARGVARRRVVVKRPLRAMPLVAGPDLSYRGKMVRFDVYFPG